MALATTLNQSTRLPWTHQRWWMASSRGTSISMLSLSIPSFLKSKYLKQFYFYLSFSIGITSLLSVNCMSPLSFSAPIVVWGSKETSSWRHTWTSTFTKTTRSERRREWLPWWAMRADHSSIASMDGSIRSLDPLNLRLKILVRMIKKVLVLMVGKIKLTKEIKILSLTRQLKTTASCAKKSWKL